MAADLHVTKINDVLCHSNLAFLLWRFTNLHLQNANLSLFFCSKLIHMQVLLTYISGSEYLQKSHVPCYGFQKGHMLYSQTILTSFASHLHVHSVKIQVILSHC